MTERKYKSYTLWLHWDNSEWTKAITCLNLPFPAENPREILYRWARSHYPQYWKRKDWMVLPAGRKPKGMKHEKNI